MKRSLNIVITIVISIFSLLCCSRSPEERRFEIVSTLGTPDGPGGAVLVIEGNSVVFEYSSGVCDVATGESITSASNFRLASVTKQFTASCILILRDRGALTLDQPLTDFFPEFSAVGQHITVQQLLCHRSGLIAYEDVMPDTTTVPVLDRDVLRLVQSIDSTTFPPGTRYRYSNTGYALLALIVERTSGMRFADFLKKEIFTPVGMNATVAFENGISEVPHRAYGHLPSDTAQTGYIPDDQSMTSSVLGDGGIYSSVHDLARWHWSLEHPEIFSPETFEEATSVHSENDDGSVKYGYGWFIEEISGEKVEYHTGSTHGFRNALFRVPGKRVAVIVLTNRDDGPAKAIARDLLTTVLE